MKKLGTIALCCAAVGALGASGAYAVGNGHGKGPGPVNGGDDSGVDAGQIASRQCTDQLHAMGAKAFKALYGKNAMRTCKAKGSSEASSVAGNAAQQCRAEQADPNFVTAHNGLTFAQFYGTNPNDANAFGKCVSGKVQTAEDQNEQQLQNAAQACRAERADPNFAASHDGKSFTDFYGSNKNKKNAFGKCVSQKAHAGAQPPATS
jgi:hypothetical protein